MHGPDSEQKRVEHPCAQQGRQQSYGHSYRRYAHAPQGHHPSNPVRLGAQRHTHRNLPSAIGYDIGQNPEEPNGLDTRHASYSVHEPLVELRVCRPIDELIPLRCDLEGDDVLCVLSGVHVAQSPETA